VIPRADRRLRAADELARRRRPNDESYQAEPRSPVGPVGSVLVIQRNRGLNAHIAGRRPPARVAGYRAVAADFLSPVGGTPADQDAAREAIGKLDLAAAAADAVATLRLLESLPGATARPALSASAGAAEW
jgi:carboxymethylenebutenolidase